MIVDRNYKRLQIICKMDCYRLVIAEAMTVLEVKLEKKRKTASNGSANNYAWATTLGC